MDGDAPDDAAPGEPHVCPRVTAIGGSVNAVAPRRRVAIVGFAGADPNNPGIGGCDGDVADRGGPFVFEDCLK